MGEDVDPVAFSSETRAYTTLPNLRGERLSGLSEQLQIKEEEGEEREACLKKGIELEEREENGFGL